MISRYELGRLAREAAIRREDDHVGSEHFLLAVLVEPKLRASRVLASAGLSAGSVEAHLRNNAGTLPSEHVCRSYSFDISESVSDPGLRELVLGLKKNQPVTDEMTEILAASRSWEEVTPELIVAEVLSRPHLSATQIVSSMDVDVASIIDQLRN